MTIANGNTITASDLDAWVTTQLGLIQNDNEQKPAGVLLNFFFPDLVTGTPERQRKAIFVMPFDGLVEAVASQCGDHTASSAFTVALTGDGALVNWPTSQAGTVGAGITKPSRLLYDNTKTKASLNFSTTAQAFRCFTKGSTVTLVVSSASIATPSACQVCVVMRQFFMRE